MWFTTVGWVGRVTLDGVVTFFTVSGDPTPQLDGIAVGSDGKLWFTEVFPDAMVGRITTDGTVTRFPLPDGASFPGAVAACPGATDPSLYVTDSSADALFQVRTDGTATTIPIPTADAWPMGVTCGVDGRIWFAEWAADQIGQLVP
jgi:virginiamycin B lyase